MKTEAILFIIGGVFIVLSFIILAMLNIGKSNPKTMVILGDKFLLSEYDILKAITLSPWKYTTNLYLDGTVSEKYNQSILLSRRKNPDNKNSWLYGDFQVFINERGYLFLDHNSNIAVGSSEPLPLNTKIKLEVVFDGDNLIVYVDGTEFQFNQGLNLKAFGNSYHAINVIKQFDSNWVYVENTSFVFTD